ncbi:MAG: MarR family winged helix-turn-helix transcriptional regulator [Lachnospiraceae bacterium]|nr:MarR family winged helix-turn-helix transcriptional regulator [Lachnospiraceae bacterium]
MFDISFADKISRAYTRSCKALCHELDIPQTAFDILMFLANHPEYKSARDIVEIRRIKANLVSINVDRLVQEGLLVRREVAHDRRKVELELTEKAAPIVERGRTVQKQFIDTMLQGIDETTLEAFRAALMQMEENIKKTEA